MIRGGSEGGQGGRGPFSEIYGPLWPTTCENFPVWMHLLTNLMLGIRTESLLCISCHFNAIMFCDIGLLMIYITY